MINLIKNNILFKKCTDEEINEFLHSFTIQTKNYKKNEVIFHTGDIVDSIGIVLEGKIEIEMIDYLGNKNILNIISRNGIFAEAYALLEKQPLFVDVVAIENTKILFINAKQLMNENICACQQKIIKNLVMISSKKNITLSNRMYLTTPKTIRERLNAYFSEQMSIQNSNTIILPFNRQQMADYLNVERSALSKELMKMKNEGILEYHKNEFIIKI